jgi:hypothetical protein
MSMTEPPGNPKIVSTPSALRDCNRMWAPLIFTFLPLPRTGRQKASVTLLLKTDSHENPFNPISAPQFLFLNGFTLHLFRRRKVDPLVKSLELFFKFKMFLPQGLELRILISPFFDQLDVCSLHPRAPLADSNVFSLYFYDKRGELSTNGGRNGPLPHSRNEADGKGTNLMNISSILSVGPIGDDDILRMAALTREFNPLNVISGAAAQGGLSTPVLHSAWISGLISAGLEGSFPDAEWADIEILYCGSAFENERLTLEMNRENPGMENEAWIAAFRVLGPRRRLIARGRGAAHLHASR